MSEGRHHTPRPNTRRCTLGGICTKHGHSEAGGVDRNASGREGRALAAAADGGPTGARRRVAGENTCSGSGSAGGVATCWSESSVEIEAGDEVSRKPEQIFDEVARLIEQGVSEIIFVGQNVNSYQYTLDGRVFSVYH